VLARKHKFGETLQLSVDFDLDSGRRNWALAKILIVDDDSAVQATIRLLLERAGHSVVVANDGHKGLATLEGGNFDLVFLDVFMPGIDGLETMRLIHQRKPALPIIVISGNPGCPDYLNMATRLGAITTLQKPFKAAALLTAVARCLETAAVPSRPPDRAAGNAV
jgi:CheY-like chemotaxis protein